MTPERDYIRLLLDDLKAELRRQGYWCDQPPAPDSLNSSEPFCVDTLRLEQWLQYVFIARLEAVLDHQAPLPERCEIMPYAEEQLRQSDDPAALLRILGKLDIMVTRAV